MTIDNRNKSAGFHNIVRLEWDSKCFGFEVGKCEVLNQIKNLDSYLLEARDRNFKLIYFFSKEEQKCMNLCGIRAYQRVLYGRKRVFGNKPDFRHSVVSVESCKGNFPDESLYNLARTSGQYSRFHQDPFFPGEVFLKLYDKWLERSIFSDLATDVLVCRNECDFPIGLLTFKVNGLSSQIGLLSVDEHYRGNGMAMLLNATYEGILPDAVGDMYVVTQGDNLPARRFYEHVGYKVSDITYISHLWI